MSNNFKEIINKGVPISTPIVIRYTDLLELTDNKAALDSEINKKFDGYFDYLKTKGSVDNVDIFQTLGIISDPTTLEKKLIFSPNGFASTILYNLNVNHACNSIDYHPINHSIDDLVECMEDELDDRIKKLRNVTKEDKLRKEFPLLYKIYNTKKNEKESLLNLKKNVIDNPQISLEIKLGSIQQVQKLFDAAHRRTTVSEEIEKASKFSLESFCNEAADTLSSFIDNYDDIIEFLEGYALDTDKLDVDNEKLELYIANQSYEMCSKTDYSNIQRYLYYVTSYFNSDKTRRNNNNLKINPKVSLKKLIGTQKGVPITPAILYDKYKNFLKAHPEIKIINFDNVDFSKMNLEEVEEFVIEFTKDLCANWDIIPDDQTYNQIMTGGLKGSYNGYVVYKNQKISEAKLLYNYIEKKEFFESTDPFFRVKGKNTFKGYIAYLYTNGKVVLERYFKNPKLGKLAYGDAIYVMNIEDFYRLSNYPKRVLMRDPKVQRIYHDNDWQDDVRKIISKEDKNAKTAEEVRKLVTTKKLEEE